MIITVDKLGDITVLKAQGRLDATSSPETDKRLTEFIDGGARQIVLDLSGVDYVSSAGLRVLLSAAKRVQKVEGKLVMAAAMPQTFKILDTAGFPAIVPLFDTVSQACAGFLPQSDTVDDELHPLSIGEEMYLLALDDTRGVLKPLPVSALDYALVGAIFMELALQNRIDTDLTKMKVVSCDPTGDPLLDDILREIHKEPFTQPTLFWLKHFADHSEPMEKRVLDGLIRKGILKQEDRKVLWVFDARRYPLVEDREFKEVRTRLRDLIQSDEIPDSRDVVLISLSNACCLLDDLFSSKEFERLQPRIEALARLDLIGQAITKAIREIEQAVAVAMMASSGQHVQHLG